MNHNTQKGKNKMTNTTDITEVSDAVLDCFLLAKANKEEAVDCDHLTRTERYQLADLMGWNLNDSYVSLWCRGGSVEEETCEDSFDYEGAILEDQEDESWGN